jgi:hypothetical protein
MRVKKNFKPRRDFPIDREGYEAFKNQGWNGEYEEVQTETDDIDNTHEKQIENYSRGGSSNRSYEPSRLSYKGKRVWGE